MSRDDITPEDLLAALAGIRARGGLTAEERADLADAMADGERAQLEMVCPACEGESATGRPGAPDCGLCGRAGFILHARGGQA